MLIRILLLWIVLGHNFSAAADAALDDRWAERTKACTHCHGAQGRAGPDGYYPRLAGKPVGYLYNQLRNIRDGKRHYSPMATLLEPLTDAYLMDLASYFSNLHLPYVAPIAPLASGNELARGHALVTQGDASRNIPPCQQCHGNSLTGAAPFVPGLLGLPRDYLNAQLGGWRTGQRHAQAPDCMSLIASRLNPQDINAVTAWLAAQPLPNNSEPLTALPALASGIIRMDCGSFTSAAPLPAPKALTGLARQGEYLTQIGNCQTCHTAPGGQPYAGGRAIETPFGTAFSSNLTSDPTYGLGTWQAEDFWQAMHHGKSKDGRLLSPAFPYTEFTRVTRADADALFAYFQTVPAQAVANRPHEMRWPLGTQAALWAWRTLFFQPETFKPEPTQSAAWNRGAYLVHSLGHCASCHTPRNALGATQNSKSLSGGMVAVQNWYASSLLHTNEAGTDSAQTSQLLTLFKTGQSTQATVSGPMALVVQGSTQHWNDADLHAMLVYLQTLSQPAQAAAVSTAPSPKQPVSLPPSTEGLAIYKMHCATCHGNQGQGQPGDYPALMANRAVLMADHTNLIQTVLHGGFSPVTSGHPQPFGMPPFVLTLTDHEIAQVLSHVRSAWGNQADAVTAQEVSRLRDQRAH